MKTPLLQTLNFTYKEIVQLLNIIQPISEKGCFKIDSGKCYCLTSSPSNNIIVYSELKEDQETLTEEEFTLNLGDLSKFLKLLTLISPTNNKIDLKVYSNKIEYKDAKVRFDYHILEDHVLTRVPLNRDKIQTITGDYHFNLPYSVLQELSQLESLVGLETPKLYISCRDSKIYGTVGDFNQPNSNSVEIILQSSVNASFEKQFCLNLDIIRNMNISFRKTPEVMIKVTIKNNPEIFIFDINSSKIHTRYIVSTLTK